MDGFQISTSDRTQARRGLGWPRGRVPPGAGDPSCLPFLYENHLFSSSGSSSSRRTRGCCAFFRKSMLHRIALRLLLLLQMHMHCHAALVAPRSNLLKLRGGKADDSRWLIPGKPTLTLEAADEMASAAIREATERGFNDVAVFVLDANGRTIVSKAMLNVPNLPVKLAHAKAMICVSTGSNSRAVRDKYVPDRTPQVAASETVANHPTPARSRSKTTHAAFTIFHCTDRSRVRVAHRAFAVAANVHRRRKRRAAARRGAWRCPGPRRLK